MAASDCSFCGKHEVPCVLRKGTAAICGACTRAMGAELGLVEPEPVTKIGAQFRAAVARGNVRAAMRGPTPPKMPRPPVVMRRRVSDQQPEPAKPEPPSACSFCGGLEAPLVRGHERFRGQSDLVTVFGQPVWICRLCIERAVAALRPS